jgi:hypothetical protein
MTWDLVGRVLITAPFVFVFAFAAFNCVLDVVEADTWHAKLGFGLAAVAAAGAAAAIVFFITLDDNATWCFKAPKNDPNCTAE